MLKTLKKIFKKNTNNEEEIIELNINARMDVTAHIMTTWGYVRSKLDSSVDESMISDNIDDDADTIYKYMRDNLSSERRVEELITLIEKHYPEYISYIES